MTLMNIITRTSGRPKAFARCRESIINQQFGGEIRHIVTTDSQFDTYVEGDVIINVKKGPGGFPYNEYINEAMKYIQSGWVMFLDDDDVLFHDYVIASIISHVELKRLVFWRVQIGDKIYPPDDLIGKEPRQRKISGIGFAVRTSMHLLRPPDDSLLRWDNEKEADFRVIHRLWEYVGESTVWIDDILTATQDGWGLGKRKDVG